jgi:hypothetical protein
MICSENRCTLFRIMLERSSNPAFERGLCSQRPVGLLGPTVDPLGELLMKLLPDGLRALLAPAVALPALVLPPAPAPLMPVVVPLVVDPVAEVPPVEPLLCAKAVPLANASAAAKPIVANLIDASPRLHLSDEGQTAAPLYVPTLAKTLNERLHGAGFRERKRLACPAEAREATEHRGESPPSPFGLRRGSLRSLRAIDLGWHAQPKLAKRAKAGGR